MVRVTGLEPVRRTTHAPQTCLSASSSTPAYIPAEISELSENPDNSAHFFLLSFCLSTTMLLYHRQANLSIAFFKKTQIFSNTFLRRLFNGILVRKFQPDTILPCPAIKRGQPAQHCVFLVYQRVDGRLVAHVVVVCADTVQPVL